MSAFGLLAAVAADYARRRGRLHAQTFIFYAIAFGLAVGGAVYGLHAAFLYLATELGAAPASLLMMAGLLVAALAVMTAGYVHKRRTPSVGMHQAVSIGTPLLLGMMARRTPTSLIAIAAVVAIGLMTIGAVRSSEDNHDN